jgi:hypothetical protein
MKLKVLNSFILGASALLVSTSMLANRVQIFNQSKDIKKITVEYQVAYENDKGMLSLSHPKTIEVQNYADIPLDEIKGYRYSGIVPIAVDGHRDPGNVGNFGKPQSCTLATDERHPEGFLVFAYSGPSKEKGQLNCSKHGGTFIPNHA